MDESEDDFREVVILVFRNLENNISEITILSLRRDHGT